MSESAHEHSVSELFALSFPPLDQVLIDLPQSAIVPPYEMERITFLITKDHPERLKLTLPSLLAASDRVYVIDSSRSSDTKNLCSAMNAVNLRYHGRDQQGKMISSHKVLERALSERFITELSDDCWDIWSKRNYILLFSLLNRFSEILLIDDDVIPTTDLITDVLSLARSYSLVGANIRGMRDVSVVGHICSLNGIVNQNFISGHFLAVNVPRAAQYYFPDLYNEDWIFILLNSLSSPAARYGSIFHLYWDPFAGTGSRTSFEEVGEVFTEGLAQSVLCRAGTAPMNCLEHWSETLSRRRIVLSALASDGLVRSMPVVAGILECARTVAAAVTPRDLLKLWRDYLEKLDEWLAIVALARA